MWNREESSEDNCSKEEKGGTSHSVVLFLFCSLRMVVTNDQTQKLAVLCQKEDQNVPQQHHREDRDREKGCA